MNYKYIKLIGITIFLLSSLVFSQDVILSLDGSSLNYESTEDIGARRLHTVMERLLESISFEAADKEGHATKVDAAYVSQHLGDLAQDEDLTRYIL